MPVWNSNSGRRLRALLKPHKISSRTLHAPGNKDLKGYKRSDFQDTWERYLPPLSTQPAPAGRGATAAGHGANDEPDPDGSNQSVLNPSAPNPNDINVPDGRTE